VSLSSRNDRVGDVIIGLDISQGMLNRARRRANTCANSPAFTLIHAPAADLTPALLESMAGVTRVDFVLCTYGFTAMRDPETAFLASWNVLKPGCGYLVHDIHADRPTLHARAVELATHTCFSGRSWQLLRSTSPDFRMDYLDPSAHLFGGRLFVAWGTKPSPPQVPRHVTRNQQGRQTARAV
jgi:SAM-dependent methyltransferase